MPYLFYLAYGEGQSATTATGVFSGLIVFVISCVIFGVFAYRSYPIDRQ
ncbi:hypothetical protein IQ260_27250 [Leptolyngbya cf. ectocarpi LEGE 11479]|uniref:Uncharacterized protein n=1 Tax=Leptolyngbya cf. ectocarpi LEGE 11479 TaxID=1828722 RepID=A0A928ZZL7_LEPEC|nr:hypothetical protein [Leptolyngbya ectocarpi]MBE9070345.1 hypothetical protein [Leptolyngbya cf. ectocarpi LEGE 11479]